MKRWPIVVATALVLPAGCTDLGPTASPQQWLAEVSAGPTHACALSTDGKAYCWGSGERRELGNSPPASSFTPVAVGASIPFRHLSAGFSHTCALSTAGDAYCWGWGVFGAVGHGDFSDTAPEQVVGQHVFSAISAGWYHTCGIAEGGAAYCWGDNAQGQLGDGTFVNRAAPTAVLGGLRFAALSAGGAHTCGITTDALAYCWGGNDAGQLGTAAGGDATAPAAVVGGQRFASISAGATHSCGVNAAGVPMCWGDNSEGELGTGGTQQPGIPGSAGPVPVATGSIAAHTFRSLSAGYGFTCGVGSDAVGYCWGHGIDGQLASGFMADSPVPHSIAGLSGPAGPDGVSFHQVSAGGRTYACGASAQNGVYCWGRGDEGELGSAETTQSVLPVRVTVPR